MVTRRLWLLLLTLLALPPSALLAASQGMLAPVADANNAFNNGQGEFANTEVINRGLQLGNNRSFVPRQRPTHQLFGLYTSPPQTAPTPFTQLTATYEAAVPRGSELTFEVRTQSVNGQWSPWIEITPDQAGKSVELENPSSAWQYKFTFYAADPGHSPRVTTVSVAAAPKGGR